MEEVQVLESMPEVEVVKKRIPWLKILGIVVVALLAVAGTVYATVLKPYVVVGKSMAKLAKYDSAQVIYQTDDQKFKVVADVAGEDKPVAVRIALSGMEGVTGEWTLSGIFDEKNAYFQSNYPDPKQIDEALAAIYPLMTRTQSYKMAAPLWRGESWLHINMPESEGDDEEAEVEFDWKGDKEAQKMMKDIFLAIKPGKIEQDYGFEGESYTKVSFGFRKERLIAAIDSLKDTKAEIKVSQINSLIDIVESSDDWDRDLVAFLIDKKGDLRVIVMQVPQIDEEVLNKSISEGASEDKTGMAAGLVAGLKGMVWQEEGELVSLGTVRLGQFDQVQAPVIPTNIVEGSVLWEKIMQEFGPIIGQMLMATGGQPYPTATPRTNSNPSMYAPGQLKK